MNREGINGVRDEGMKDDEDKYRSVWNGTNGAKNKITDFVYCAFLLTANGFECK